MKHARKDYNRIQDPTNIIPEDEPVFLLRGQDKFAADVVDFYATLVEVNGGDPDVVEASRKWAEKMREWPKHKIPDL